jgi:PPP family 3-phenylpropionic acid transporter
MIQLFYFFYFQSIGIYMPFVPAYFRAQGLSGREISAIFAMQPLLAVVVPLGWSWLADRSGRHDRVLRLVIGGAWLGLTPLLFAGHFLPILLSWACYAVFGVGVGGLADALAVARVRAGAVYGRLRLWGSVGFVAAAIGVGGAVELFEAGQPGRIVPLAMWLSLAGAFAASLRLSGTGEAHAKPRAADLRELMKDRRLLLLLLIGALHWMCLAPYNVFFGVFLRDLGLRPISWGLAYATGVVAEIAVMLVFHRLERRFTLAALLAAAFAASALRWLAIGTVSAPAILIALQLLHGMTFGMFWSAAIALAARIVPPPLRATGQALLVMSINLGGAFGNALTGRLYDASGSRTMFLLAAAGELAPLLLVLRARARLRA